MSRKRDYKGWLLIESLRGWFVEKGKERYRVGYSREEMTDNLYARYKGLVDDLETRRSR